MNINGGHHRMTIDGRALSSAWRHASIGRSTRWLHLIPRQRDLVELKFFGGLTIDEVALSLGVSALQVSRRGHLVRQMRRRFEKRCCPSRATRASPRPVDEAARMSGQALVRALARASAIPRSARALLPTKRGRRALTVDLRLSTVDCRLTATRSG